MPGTNLTREEAAERKTVIGETNYRVHLDLTGNIPGHASPETLLRSILTPGRVPALSLT